MRNTDKAQKNGKKSAILMAESEGDTLCFEFRDLMTLDDYNYFMTYAKKLMDEYDNFNLLFYYHPSFRGWEPDAADANLKAILEFGSRTRRLAYINPPEKKIMQHKIAPGLFGGEMKYFTEDQRNEAIAWVKGG